MHQFRQPYNIPQWVEDDLTSQPHLTTQYSNVEPAHKWNDWLLDVAIELKLAEWRATCRIVQCQEVVAPHTPSQIDWPNLKINDRELKYYVLFTQAPSIGHFWSSNVSVINWIQGDVYAITPTVEQAQANASNQPFHYVEFEGFETTCG